MITFLALSFSSAALAFDHGYASFDAFLDGAVTDAGRVDYDLLATRRPALDTWLGEVATAPVATFTSDQKLAFYVNAYNGYTISVILDERPKSILDLDGGKVWTTRHFQVGGESLTLDDIEQTRVRKLGDGRIHAAVNCASKGCPPLPPDPLRAATVQADLDAGARRWMATNGYHIDGSTLVVSKIFDWYAADFTDAGGLAGDHPGVRAFVARFAPEADSKRIRDGGLTVTFGDYDWSLNSK